MFAGTKPPYSCHMCQAEIRTRVLDCGAIVVLPHDVPEAIGSASDERESVVKFIEDAQVPWSLWDECSSQEEREAIRRCREWLATAIFHGRHARK